MYGEEASKLARETKRTIDHFPSYNDSLVRSITREIRHLHETCQGLLREFNQQKLQTERQMEQRWQQLQQQQEQSSGSDPTAMPPSQASSSSDPNYTTLAMLDGPSFPSSSSTSTTTTATTTTPSSYSHISRRTLQREKDQAMETLTRTFWTKYLVHHTPLQRNKRILMAYHHQRLEKIKEISWAFNILPENTRRLLSPDEILFFTEYERNRNTYATSGSAGISDLDLGLGMISPPKEVFITVRVLKDCGDIVTESGDVLSLKKNSEHFVKRGDVERLITQGYLLHVA